MIPFDALKLAEQDQKFVSDTDVYWWAEYYDGTLYFVLQDDDKLHEWSMAYQQTTIIPHDDDL